MKLHLVSICLLFYFLISCCDKKAEWLKRYAQTKCAYQLETEKIKSDSIDQVSSLIAERLKLQEQLFIITSPFENKIVELNKGVKEAQREYMKSYRKAEEVQNAKFGHHSTSAYEKEISHLENIKATKIEGLQKRIVNVKLVMGNNANYKSVTEKIQMQNDKVRIALETININHKSVIDSLQELLNVENSNFKILKSELEPTEQNILELKRDSIRVNPCK